MYIDVYSISAGPSIIRLDGPSSSRNPAPSSAVMGSIRPPGRGEVETLMISDLPWGVDIRYHWYGILLKWFIIISTPFQSIPA